MQPQHKSILSRFKYRHADQACIVFGTGPSLHHIRNHKLNNIVALGVNGIGKYRSVKYNVLVDRLPPLENLTGSNRKHVESITVKSPHEYTFSRRCYPSPTKWVDYKTRNYRSGIDTCLLRNEIPSCYTCTYSAIALAIYMGFTKIGVIGFDLVNHPTERLIEPINRGCADLNVYARANGIGIFNLSDISNVDVFTHTKYDDFIRRWNNDAG